MKKTFVVLSFLLFMPIFVFAYGGGSSQERMHMKEELPAISLWAANGMDDTISVIEPGTGEIVATLVSGTNPHILSASSDGSLLYVVNAGQHDREPGAHGDGNAESDLEPESVEETSTHSGRSQSSHGDQNVKPNMEIAGALSNSLWVYNTVNGEVVTRIPVGMGPTHAIPSSDGKFVYVTNTDSDSISVIDTASWKVVDTITNLLEPHDGKLSTDGTLLFLATAGDDTLSVVNTNSREVIRKYNVGKKARGVVVGGADGKTVFLTNKGDGTISIIDVSSDESNFTFYVGEGAHALRLSPDGTILYVALSKENAVALFDVSSSQVITKINVGGLPEQIDLSSDGKWLFASNFSDSSVSIIDISDRRVIDTVAVGDGVYGLQAITRATAQFATLPRNDLGFARIDAERLKEALTSKGFSLVNVHIPYAGDIPDTDLNIRYDRIVDNLDLLPDRDQPIVVYCRSGSMSRIASEQLVQLGFINVVELDGGFNAWRRAGFDLAE